MSYNSIKRQSIRTNNQKNKKVLHWPLKTENDD